jgi:hypothetical protein
MSFAAWTTSAGRSPPIHEYTRMDIPRLAAQQLVNRRVVVFPFDVPQRLINAGDGAHQDGPTTVKTAAIEHVPMILDVQRIPPDEMLHELLNGRAHGRGPSFDHRFTPTRDASVRVDAKNSQRGGTWKSS